MLLIFSALRQIKSEPVRNPLLQTAGTKARAAGQVPLNIGTRERDALESPSMRILVVATKSPWPPCDGGRLALWLTLKSLAEAGHELALVAPVDNSAAADDNSTRDMLGSIAAVHLVIAPRRSWLAAGVAAVGQRQALTLARHHLVDVEAKVAELLRVWRPDVVHVEQLQALANGHDAARAAGVPVVLRMQNVESSLWHQVARARLRSWPLRWEATRLQRDENRALHQATRVLTLTGRDADQLRSRVDAGHAACINCVGPPFPMSLDAAAAVNGAPAVVLAGSSGWWPNREGTEWFLATVAPLLVRANPELRIHVFGGACATSTQVIGHEAPKDSMTAFPQQAIAAIPLHIGSGIRMRILEAWARGLPVVASTTAAAGLDVVSGRELMIADSPEDFTAAIQRIAADADLYRSLVAAGRDYLRQHHDSVQLAAALVAEYRSAIAAGGRGSG
jgi:polysaccharide biosynthesis protein PslH